MSFGLLVMLFAMAGLDGFGLMLMLFALPGVSAPPMVPPPRPKLVAFGGGAKLITSLPGVPQAASSRPSRGFPATSWMTKARHFMLV